MTNNFVKLLVASASSNFGDGLFKVAFPLAAVRLTDSPALVAGVTLALTLPDLLVALPAGALADRFDRRTLMVVLNGLRVLVLSALAIGIAVGLVDLVGLYVAAFLLGTFENVFDTAAQSMIPQTVPEQSLERANSSLYAAEIVLNEFVGPPLGGALVGLSLALAFTGSAVTYVVAIAALVVIIGRYRPLPTRHDSLLEELIGGVRFLFAHRLLRTLALMVSVMVLSYTAWFALLPLYAVRGPMGLTEFQYGLLLVSFAVGGLIGTAVADPAIKRFGRSRVLWSNVAGQSLMFLAPALTASFWLVAAALVVGSITSVAWSVVTAGLRQRLVPEQVFGRFQGAWRMVSWGSAPLGAVGGGLIAELVGVRGAFVAAAATTLLLIVALRVVNSREIQAILDVRP